MEAPRNHLDPALSERGQSLTEMIVMLPVLLLIFLGLFHFQGIVQMRMRAIEAARYVNWEAAWHARGYYGGMLKDDAQLEAELRNMGLGRDLVRVRGAAQRRTLDDYAGAVSGEASAAFLVVADRLFPELQTDEGTLGDVLGGIEDASQEVTDVLRMFDRIGYAADLTMAGNTGWLDEGQNAVYTARVIYSRRPEAFFRPFGATTVDARSSLLSHAYNINRPALPNFIEASAFGSGGTWFSDDGMKDEYEQVFGGTAIGDCNVNEPNGHVFDLWLFPSGNLLAGIGGETATQLGSIFSSVGRGVKCAIVAPFDFLQAIDDLIGTDLGFHMPEGTLMEYPEKWSSDD
jgi:hypothetical protein